MSLPWKKTVLEKQIEELQQQLEGMEIGSPEHMAVLSNLQELSRANEAIKPKRDSRNQININTLLVVGGSIVEILLMMHYEELRSFTTKAMSRVIKPKL